MGVFVIIKLVKAIGSIILGIVPKRKRKKNGRNKLKLIIVIELYLFTLAIISSNIAYLYDDQAGIIKSFIILPIAGCESAIALSLLINYYPKRGTLIKE
jgi:NADH:ubiquinone oxidoreductase subunit K